VETWFRCDERPKGRTRRQTVIAQDHFGLIAPGSDKCFNYFWSVSLQDDPTLCYAFATMRERLPDAADALRDLDCARWAIGEDAM
jgi:hypothetical protein